MGSFFSVGLKPEGQGGGVRNLDIGLNRQASNLMEALFDEVLQDAYPAIHEKIMETLPLDQINFDELSPTDFNKTIQAIRNCLAGRTAPKDWQKWQKELWEQSFEPLVRQDFVIRSEPAAVYIKKRMQSAG